MFYLRISYLFFSLRKSWQENKILLFTDLIKKFLNIRISIPFKIDLILIFPFC